MTDYLDGTISNPQTVTYVQSHIPTDRLAQVVQGHVDNGCDYFHCFWQAGYIVLASDFNRSASSKTKFTVEDVPHSSCLVAMDQFDKNYVGVQTQAFMQEADHVYFSKSDLGAAFSKIAAVTGNEGNVVKTIEVGQSRHFRVKHGVFHDTYYWE